EAPPVAETQPEAEHHAPPIVLPEHASEAQSLTEAALPNESAPEDSVDALVAAAEPPVTEEPAQPPSEPVSEGETTQ
ncbi:MAG: hypothetical protein WB615_10630, partial [Candidatus Tumulicola sp.]